jgi:hypothetical protein
VARRLEWNITKLEPLQTTCHWVSSNLFVSHTSVALETSTTLDTEDQYHSLALLQATSDLWQGFVKASFVLRQWNSFLLFLWQSVCIKKCPKTLLTSQSHKCIV